MKQKLILLSIITLFIGFNSAKAQTGIEWEACYGGPLLIGELRDVCETEDGGYIMVGSPAHDTVFWTNTYEQTYSDVGIVRIDSVGAVVWKRTFGGDKFDNANCIIKGVRPDRYYIGGRTCSESSMNYHGPSTLDDAWLIAIDGQGFVEWQRCYGGIYYEDFKSLVQMEDSNVIYGLGAAGDINGDVLASYGNGDGWICKIDANTGLLLKSRNYGGSNADQFLRSAKLNKNSFLAMAQTYSQDHDVWMSYSTINQEGWLLNIDTALNIVWQKTIGSTGDAYLYDVINTKDGGFLLIGGTTNSPGDTSSFNFYVNNRQEEVYMLKYDSLGNELGQYHYGAPVDHVYFHGGIVEMQDGGYVFSANVNRWNGFALSPFNKGTVLFRTNSAGSLISTSRYGNGVSATLSLFNLFTTPDNGLVTFGGGVTCHQNAWGAMRIGNQLGLTDQEQLDFPIKLYPNPSSGIFNLSIETNENIERVVIFNSLGQQIGGLHKQASNRYTINLSGESKGIYFVVMEIGEELVYRKLVLE